ncbi:MAG: LysM peptidoglycan-binding domain-containing protein [Anaerolineae bacterium]|nr:LysM peptidoglycan-binding domain-containing protein [Anaerolineae bacterium]
MRRLIFLIAVLIALLSVGIAVQAQDNSNPIVHTVAAGENLYRISLRYGVSMAAIAQENNLADVNVLFVGQQLTIPNTTGGTTSPPDTTPPDTTPDTTSPPATGSTYTIQRGDTLASIARQFNTTFGAIAAANGLSNVNLIFVGQELIIPGADGTTPPPTDGGNTTPPPPADSGDTVTYTVQAGDSLGSIARRFNTTISDIAARNGITNVNLIFPGQQLLISGTAPVNNGSTPGGSVTNPPNTNPVTGFQLGGHVTNSSYPFSDAMRGAGMTWSKRQIRWSRGTPASDFQGEIDAAHSRGFRVLLSVVGNPNEISGNPSQYYQEFAQFLGGLAAGGADGIEVWNEPNIEREWPAGLISGAQYAQMLSAAFQTIKANNPNTLVVSAAPAPSGGLPNNATVGFNDDIFIRAMAQAGASQFMDCVGIHYNAGTVPPSATSGAPVGSSTHYSWYYPTMVSLYSGTIPGKPLCFTEIGYLSGEGFSQGLPGNFSWANGNSVQEQAQWLAQAAVRARNSGAVRLFIVWNVDSTTFLPTDPQGGYAIIRPDGTCPACNTLASQLGG